MRRTELACRVMIGLLLLIPSGLPTASAQSFVTLYAFRSGADGASPYGTLLQGPDGALYGTTRLGGANDDGTVFRVTASGALTTLHEFTGFDGQWPQAGLIQGSDGAFYGTTSSSVYKITAFGAFTLLCTFGDESLAPLVQGSDVNFYGTTWLGGQYKLGTVFKVTPSGTLTTLYSFTGYSDGENPTAGLLQGSDGNLYGTTTLGGNGGGTVFKITPSGTFTTLYAFQAAPYQFGPNVNGASPEAALVTGSDGAFYGTTSNGGAFGFGTTFRITLDGALTTLHDFTGGVDGGVPYDSLLLAQDGNFYGTTHWRGFAFSGGVFRMTPSGVVTPLGLFLDGADEAVAGLVQGRDGNLYGATTAGGPDYNGTIFEYYFHSFFFQNPATGQLAVWTRSGVTAPFAASFEPLQDPAWRTVGTAVIRTWLVPAILLQNTQTGQMVVWIADGGSIVNSIPVTPTPDPAWKAIAFADFNRDEQPDILLQNTTTGQLAVWYMTGYLSNAIATQGAVITPTPPAGWNVVGVDYFGQGTGPSILFQNASTGALAVWYLNGTNAFQEAPIMPIPAAGWKAVGVERLSDGSGNAILFQNQSDGRLAFWTLNGVTQTGTVPFYQAPPPGWSVIGLTDFNNDSEPDVVFQQTGAQQFAVWYLPYWNAYNTLYNTIPIGATYLPVAQSAPWRAVGLGDFEGNGRPDVLVQSKTTNHLLLWHLDGTIAISGLKVTPTPPWNAVAVADFNGDGAPDILFEDPKTGQLAIWLMAGTKAARGVHLSPDPLPGWNVVGTGDFNGDGKPDILFQNANTGQLAIWLMSGTTVLRGIFITPAQDPAWRSAAVTDVNGDGQPDIVFQNASTGQLAVWYMNGTQVIGGATIVADQQPEGQIFAAQ